MIGPARLFIEIVLAIIIALTVVLVVAAVRIAQSPWPVPYLAPMVADALTDPSSGRHVEIGEVVLIWDAEDHAFALEVHDAVAREASGRMVAAADIVVVRLSTRSLLRGHIRPRDIAVVRPELLVMRHPDGSVEVAVGGAGPVATDTAQPVDRPLSHFFEATSSGSLAALRRLRILDGHLKFDDQRHNEYWDIPGVSIEVDRQPGGVNAALSLETMLGGAQATLSATARFHSESGRVDGSAVIRGVRPSAVAERLPELADIGRIDLPVEAELRYAVLETGQVLDFSVSVVGGAGRITDPILPNKALPVDRLSVKGGYIGTTPEAPARVSLEQAEIQFAEGGPLIKASGTVTDPTGQMTADLDATVDALAIDDFPKYWPQSVGAHPRAWITANLSRGAARDVAVKAQLTRAGPDKPIELAMLDGRIAVDNARVKYFGQLPPGEQVGGTVVFDASHFDIAIKTGRVQGLIVDSGRVVISGLEGDDHRIAIDLAVRGPVSNALTVLDSPPLGYIKRFGMKPKSVGGQASARLLFKFPLLADLPMEKIVIGAQATLTDVSAPAVIRGIDLTQGNFTLTLDASHLEMNGAGRLNTVPSEIGWIENFPDKVPFRRRLQVAAEVDETALGKFGVDVIGMVEGPMAGTLDYLEPEAKRAELKLNFNTKTARVFWDTIKWSKPVGEPGSARFDIALEDGRITDLRNGLIEGAGLTARLSGTLEPSGKPKIIDLKRVTFGESDVHGRVTWAAKGGYVIKLEGPQIDVSPWFTKPDPPPEHPVDDDDENEPSVPLDLDLSINRVIFGPDRTLQGFRGKAVHTGLHWENASLDGRIGGKAPLSIRLTPQGDHRDLRLTADDAGSFLKMIDLTGTVLGGKMSVSGRLENQERRLTAKMEMSDYRLVKAPILAQLLAVASITGIPQLLTGEGIAFRSMTADIVRTKKKIEILDAKAAGLALGLTAKGTITRPEQQLDLSGTIVPIYGLNSVINAIPIIGSLLTGGDGGGLFAWTYSVKGAVDKPEVSVNPLSALAPSFIRNLFETLGDLGTPTPPAATAPVKPAPGASPTP